MHHSLLAHPTCPWPWKSHSHCLNTCQKSHVHHMCGLPDAGSALVVVTEAREAAVINGAAVYEVVSTKVITSPDARKHGWVWWSARACKHRLRGSWLHVSWACAKPPHRSSLNHQVNMCPAQGVLQPLTLSHPLLWLPQPHHPSNMHTPAP